MSEAAAQHGQRGDSDRQVKLIGALDELQEYPIHYRNLVLVLSLGVELIEVHKAIKFSQSFW